MDTIEIVMTCPFCGDLHSVTVRKSDLRLYEDGELVQRAFPYLSATEREQIVSGMCPACQSSFYGEEDEDWDDEDWAEDAAICERESLASTGQWW